MKILGLKLPTFPAMKVLSWVAKIATLIISAPATWAVVSNAYTTGSPYVKLIVNAAAVVLVEVIFLYFWVRVEDKTFRQTLSVEIYRAYVVGAWIMYLVLVVLGLLHGEGLVAIPIRGSIGLLLGISTLDTLQHFVQRTDEQIARGQRPSRAVVKKQKEANDAVAVAVIDANKKAHIGALQTMQTEFDSKALANLQKHLQAGAPLLLTGLLVNAKANAKANGNANLILLANAKANDEQINAKAKTNVANEFANDSLVFQNGTYAVFARGSKFAMECQYPGCSETHDNPSYLKDTLISAKRAGSGHKRKHTQVHYEPEDEITFSK